MKNPFKLEKPYALPSRLFSKQKVGQYTWEDWEDQMKREKPFLFFLNETIPKTFRKIYNRYIKPPIYWINYFIIKHQSWIHINKNIKLVHDIYNYYYIMSSREKMEKSLIASFLSEVNRRLPNLAYSSSSDKEYDEILNVYNFFTKTLPEEINNLYNNKNLSPKEYNDIEDKLIEIQDQYIERLFQIRKIL
jgi:hypothetical protein